jgi:hypothetical protein
MFNLKKFGGKKALDTSENQLARERKEMGTSADLDGATTNHRLDEVRKNPDGDETTQLQLEDVREADVTEGKTTDGQLGHHKAPEGFVPTRTDSEKRKFFGLPINELAESRDQEQTRAFNDAVTLDGNTDFWDRAFDKVKVVPHGPSQLHNNQSRVSKLTPENVAENPKLKEMVMASLKDADAMLFHIYYVAKTAGRELTEGERNLVSGITNDKVKIATVLGLG